MPSALEILIHFITGGLHRNPGVWDKILFGYSLKDTVNNWIHDKINIRQFSQHFKGS